MSANWEKELDELLRRQKELDEEADEYRQVFKNLFGSVVKGAFDDLSKKLSEYKIVGAYIYKSKDNNDYADFIVTKDRYSHFFFRVWIEMIGPNFEITCEYGQHEDQPLTKGDHSSKISMDTPEKLKETIIEMFITSYEGYLNIEIL